MIKFRDEQTQLYKHTLSQEYSQSNNEPLSSLTLINKNS